MVSPRPSLPRGMRDFLPAEMRRRDYVFGVIKEYFARYGFAALDTPTLEKRETLLGKYGEDAQPLIYHARHESGKEALSLRYDLTVPLARVVAMHENELPLPFKRYQIRSSLAGGAAAARPLSRILSVRRRYRGQRIHGRRCRTDRHALRDPARSWALVKVKTGHNFCVRINNRKLLHGIGEYAGVEAAQLSGSLSQRG